LTRYEENGHIDLILNFLKSANSEINDLFPHVADQEIKMKVALLVYSSLYLSMCSGKIKNTDFGELEAIQYLLRQKTYGAFYVEKEKEPKIIMTIVGGSFTYDAKRFLEILPEYKREDTKDAIKVSELVRKMTNECINKWIEFSGESRDLKTIFNKMLSSVNEHLLKQAEAKGGNSKCASLIEYAKDVERICPELLAIDPNTIRRTVGIEERFFPRIFGKNSDDGDLSLEF